MKNRFGNGANDDLTLASLPGSSLLVSQARPFPFCSADHFNSMQHTEGQYWKRLVLGNGKGLACETTFLHGVWHMLERSRSRWTVSTKNDPQISVWKGVLTYGAVAFQHILEALCISGSVFTEVTTQVAASCHLVVTFKTQKPKVCIMWSKTYLIVLLSTFQQFQKTFNVDRSCCTGLLSKSTVIDTPVDPLCAWF